MENGTIPFIRTAQNLIHLFHDNPLGLPETLPALRLLLVLDNLAGHLSQAFVCWLFTMGIMPLYTPLGGSWLNMAESFQRILKRRALEGQYPQSSAEIIALLEQTAQGWNRQPTPFDRSSTV
jgi:transposase